MLASGIIADLCIYVLTWNVGTNHPRDVSFTDALSQNGTSKCPDQKMPDIYVIGLQEVNTANRLSDIFQDNPWVFKAKEYLDSEEYVKVETEQLQGIFIMLFAQTRHLNHMKDIETATTSTGFGGFWGNKGAASIRMSLYGTGVVFVVSHLAAHDKELKERIIDYNQIVNNHKYDVPKYRHIFDHDFVFWFGDLNFRLNGVTTAWDVRSMVEQNRLDELFRDDQLLTVRQSGNAFALLSEMEPSFPPTFKFHEGSSEYDLKRRPAWCDRILHRVEENKYPNIVLNLTQLSYSSHPQYVLSDHKPVSAAFQFRIESQSDNDEELYERTHGGASSENTPLASVIIIASLIAFHGNLI